MAKAYKKRESAVESLIIEPKQLDAKLLNVPSNAEEDDYISKLR